MEIHFKIVGLLLIMLALMHLGFPRYFKWAEELGRLSLVNRQMMYIHTLFIGLLLLLMGLLCFTSSSELISSALGKKVTIGLGVFWFIRLLIQFFGYSSRLWKGKVSETVIHVLFLILWAYMSIVFLAPFLISHIL